MEKIYRVCYNLFVESAYDKWGNIDKMGYIAHRNETLGTVQSVKVHSEHTAALCAEFAVQGWETYLYNIGLLHDIGKYQPDFVRRIQGENIAVEHSICGALAAKVHYHLMPLWLMTAYCIAGHHTGIPDGGFPNDDAGMSTLLGRLKRRAGDYSAYQDELTLRTLDEQGWLKQLVADCGRDEGLLIDKFAFLTRYAFSCLVDADTQDTAAFCAVAEAPEKLKADFEYCRLRIEQKLASFTAVTELQRARARLQAQVFRHMNEPAEIYLMNMPTGSGKTLASVRMALERVLNSSKKRIIYVIPYNSIIDQTAAVLEELFGDKLGMLRHQSSFSYEDAENLSEDYRSAAKAAIENWDAPFILTTAVQFFESVHSNKRGKLRKLHNMSDAILIFDEAHLMPIQYLQSCLQAVSFITRYLNSEAVFLTATMPDFEMLIRKYALPDSRIVRLVRDMNLFSEFQKYSFQFLGRISDEVLLERAGTVPSSLIIVNRKETARRLYELCVGRKFHLSTYMTGLDRRRVLEQIRAELEALQRDYPAQCEVPPERCLRIFSTSLIEAGVDLDVHTVFRERCGLDSILQAAGRCNREGKRERGEVFIFDTMKRTEGAESQLLQQVPLQEIPAAITLGLLERYDSLSSPACISEYYQTLFVLNKDKIEERTLHRSCQDIRSIPFKSYAEHFELIDSRNVSLVVPRDERSQRLTEALRYGALGSGRKLQNYVCTLTQAELKILVSQHAANDYGSGIFCLTNPDYYDPETGIHFEGQDYII